MRATLDIRAAAEALAKTGFYVEGSDPNLSAYLKTITYPGLGIAFLQTALPDLATLAAKLSGGTLTTLVFVNSGVAAYSPTDQGRALDTLERAQSITTTDRETARVFARDARPWAYAPPPPPVPATPTADTNWAIIGIGGATAVLGALGVFVALRWRSTRMQGVTIEKVPSPVREGLQELLQLRERVVDVNLRSDIAQICNDLGFLFKSNPYTQKGLLAHHVSNACRVLKQYLAIQDVPKRYAVNGPQLMEQAARSIHEFSEAVLQLARNSNGEAISDFQINTEILSAARNSLTEGT